MRDKTSFVEALAKKLKKNPIGIRANWFTMGKIPDQHRVKVEKELVKWLAKESDQVIKELMNEDV